MGTGIAAAIPIDFKLGWDDKYNSKYFSEIFLDGYIYHEEKKIYSLKEELLVDNYQSFLKEFYDLIGEPRNLEDILAVTNFNDFEAAFDENKRNMSMPFLYSGAFSFLGVKSGYYWLFYSGSYKAYLEEYQTLLHFDRILSKAMKNPLAAFVKFGIFG